MNINAEEFEIFKADVLEDFILTDLYSDEIKDKNIVWLFYTERGKINFNYFRESWINSHPNIFTYINKRFNDSDSIYENLYRLKNGLYERPVCVICGGRVHFDKQHKFARHCCAKCSAMDDTTKQAHKNTCEDRYGVTSYTKTDEYRKRLKDICLEKYGVEHYTKSDSVKERQKNTCLKKYGHCSYCETDEFKEKSKNTSLLKYGTESPNSSESVKEKQAKTCLEKYGTKSFLETEKCRYAMRESRKKRIGHGGSIKEDMLYEFLIEKFQEVKREYKSEEYPFHCDFYIPSIHLYIEFNGMWTHGGKAFDSTNQEDIEKLNIWKKKAETSSYYRRAIIIWTEEDVSKREWARLNSLKWIEGWKIKDIIDTINNLNV